MDIFKALKDHLDTATKEVNSAMEVLELDKDKQTLLKQLRNAMDEALSELKPPAPTANGCAICRNLLVGDCIKCEPNQAGTTNEKCNVAWGKCNHAFHFHCISRWLRTRGLYQLPEVCPLDNRDWEFQKHGH